MRASLACTWIATSLLLLASCYRTQSSWGSTAGDVSWAEDLTQDESTRVPGLAEGSISNIQLHNGTETVHIMLWSNASGHSYSSGGSKTTELKLEGHMSFKAAEPVPFLFTTTDGVHVSGTIGGQVYTLQQSALFLVHADAAEVQVQQVVLAAEDLEMLELGEKEPRQEFAEQWGVARFFRSASGH